VSLLPDISWRAFRVWQRNADVYKMRWRPSLIANLGEPILYLIAFGIGLGAYIGSIKGISYLQFLAPGLIVSGVMYSASFECTFGSYTRMSEQKIYDGIIATPLSIEDVILGEILWGATKSLITATIMFFVISLFGLIGSYSALCIFPFVLAEGFLFSAAALLYTSFALSYEYFSYYINLFLTPMLFLCGVFFPIERLPSALQIVSHLLPLRYAVEPVRGIILGSFDSSLLFCLFVLFLFALLFSYLAVAMMKKRLIR
jgi:lipooligosaccharide transport system permease protein